jgi:hypothetical protein
MFTRLADQQQGRGISREEYATARNQFRDTLRAQGVNVDAPEFNIQPPPASDMAGEFRRDMEARGIRMAPAAAPTAANVLAAQQGVTPPQNVNQFAAAGAAPNIDDLRRRYNLASRAGSPDAAVFLKQIEAALKTTPDPAELRTMEVLGYPRTPEGYAAFRGAQMRENQPGALVPILRNGKPVLVPREEAVGQTPFSPTSVQVLGMGPGREPAAPTITQIQDPTNPGQMITIDARRYQGGGVGSPGVIGASGKAAPAAAAAVKQEQGVSKADDILSTLESAYAQLRERKAIPSEKTNALTNIWASIAASAPGQVAGRTVGTAAQTQRDIIQSSRNQLLLAIKDATGLSAQQLNSNMELQTWLSSLTDPTRSIEANEAILQNVRRFITSGGKYTARSDAGTPPAPAPAPAPAPGAAAGNTVTLPNGTVMTFPNAEAAAKFKRDARLP